MWRPLYWVVLVSCVAGYIVAANAFYIHEARTTRKEAAELCQRNGSHLAVLDSQQKIKEVSGKLKSLKYGNKKFWIGLVFNASTEQFVWDTGELADENFINSTCLKHRNAHNNNWCYFLKKHLNVSSPCNKDWCYLVTKHLNVSSPCFHIRECQKRYHRYGYICQSSSSKDKTMTTTGALRTTLKTTATPRYTTSNVDTIQSTMTTSKPSSSRISSDSGVKYKTITTPRYAASSIHATQSTTTTSKPSSSSISSDSGVKYKTITTPSYTASSVHATQSTTTTSKPSSFSISSDLGVKDKIHSKDPVLEFSTVVASLNPKDPLSLKLVTDAYKDFAISAKLITDTKTDHDYPMMESARVIEEFAFRYASFNLNASKRQERKENQHIVLQVSLVPKGYQRNFTFTEEDYDDEVARITLPSHLFQNQSTVVVNVLYRDLHEHVGSLNPRNSQIDSSILGSSVRPSEHKVFTKNVTIVLRTFQGNDNSERKNCVFWKWNYSHPAKGSWSGEGCSLVESNRSHVVCTCNHLTNFAILMNIKQYQVPHKHKQALNFITYIGLGISLLGETITILAYMLLLCSKHDQQSHVHVNLVATLATAQMIFLAGIEATQDQVLCITVAALIHYFYLASFCWMLIEGVMLYLLIIEVYNTELKMRFCYCFSFGFPGIVVGGTLLIAHLKDKGIGHYKANKWCWLSTENYYIWSFAAPVILITAVNILVFCGVVREMVSMPSTQSSKLNAVKTTVKACIVLFPLLGITWLFGLLSIAQAGVVPQYIFTVLNSVQGLLIFLLHCVRNTEIRAAWTKKLQRVKKRAWRLFNIGSPPATSTSERQSVELSRKSNKIAPVEG